MSPRPLMTAEELSAAWKIQSFVFRSPRVTSEYLEEQIARDEVHLQRKINWWKAHRDMPVQLHPVEGMSTGAIIDRMVAQGIPRTKILEAIASEANGRGESRHFVGDSLERGRRSRSAGSAGADLTNEGELIRWSRSDLTTLVRSYLEKLRFQERNIRFRPADHVSDLRDRSLRHLSLSHLREGFTCISGVLQRSAHPWLEPYKPLAPLPEAMAADIENILAELGYEFPTPGFTIVDEETVGDAGTATNLAVSRAGVPVGNRTPAMTMMERREFERDPTVRAWVLKVAKGCCEACGNAAPFLDESDAPFLEVHHVLPLAQSGPDVVENAAALCPNCHRRCHHAADRLEFVDALYARVGRLQRTP